MAKDYYDILGVNKELSSEDDIKKAYKKLAKKYHPDNKDDGNVEKFKEITEAFDVLSNADKKLKYDRFGTVDSARHSPFDIFNSFFHGETEMGFSVDPNVQTNCMIDFVESIFGCKKHHKVERYNMCSLCNGNGSKNGNSLETCRYCHGTGMHTQQQGFFQINTTCPVCRGGKKQIKNKCDSCEGGLKLEEHTFDIDIPAGVVSGMCCVLQGQGNCSRNDRRGHIYCRIQVKDHPLFFREDNNIICCVPIMYHQAILGDTIHIPNINGNFSKLEIPSFTKHDTEFIVSKINNGNFVVRVKLNIPDNIDDAYKAMLQHNRNLSCETVYNYNDECKKFAEGIK